jgi:hypothetical protein
MQLIQIIGKNSDNIYNDIILAILFNKQDAYSRLFYTTQLTLGNNNDNNYKIIDFAPLMYTPNLRNLTIYLNDDSNTDLRSLKFLTFLENLEIHTKSELNTMKNYQIDLSQCKI